MQETPDVTTPSTQTTTRRKGWRFATESPWTLWHNGGSRDTHGTLVPKQGRPWVARRNLHEDDQRQKTTRQRQASRQSCFQSQLLTRTWKLAELELAIIMERIQIIKSGKFSTTVCDFFWSKDVNDIRKRRYFFSDWKRYSHKQSGWCRRLTHA